MTRGETFIAGMLLLLIAAFGYYFFFGSSLFSRREIEEFDKLIARVDNAVNAGRFVAGLEAPVCQADTPKHIGELVHDLLHSKPVLECTSALQPGTGLAKPLAVVNFDAKQVDAINDTVPERLRAPDLSDAATIAFVHCTKRKTGSYGFFRDAYAQDCNVLLVAANEPAGMRILGLAFFRAVPPEKIDTRFSFFGDIVADRPDFEMRYYIVSRFVGSAEPTDPSATR